MAALCLWATRCLSAFPQPHPSPCPRPPSFSTPKSGSRWQQAFAPASPPRLQRLPLTFTLAWASTTQSCVVSTGGCRRCCAAVAAVAPATAATTHGPPCPATHPSLPLPNALFPPTHARAQAASWCPSSISASSCASSPRLFRPSKGVRGGRSFISGEGGQCRAAVWMDRAVDGGGGTARGIQPAQRSTRGGDDDDAQRPACVGAVDSFLPPEFDLPSIQALFRAVDYVGLSAYIPQANVRFQVRACRPWPADCRVARTGRLCRVATLGQPLPAAPHPCLVPELGPLSLVPLLMPLIALTCRRLVCAACVRPPIRSRASWRGSCHAWTKVRRAAARPPGVVGLGCMCHVVTLGACWAPPHAASMWPHCCSMPPPCR